jgi:type II secretory pathway component HofQ
MLRAVAVVAMMSMLSATATERSGSEAGPLGSMTRGERVLCRPGSKYRGTALDLDVKDADIHDVYRLLSDVGNINIVVADNVRGKVTMKLKRVAWDLVACTIASMHKLEVTVHDNVVLVKKP